MRKILVAFLLFGVFMCGISFAVIESVCAAGTELDKYYDDNMAAPDFLYTREEIESYCERYRSRLNFPDNFVMPEELAFLGTMDYLWAPGVSNTPFFRYSYILNFNWNENYQASCTFSVYDQHLLDLSEATDVSSKKISSLTELEYPYVVMEPQECCYIKRGELYYIYYSYGLTTIEWVSNNTTFVLSFDFDSWIINEPGDSFMADLLSLEEEPFLKVQQQLLSIGNPNPTEQEVPCVSHTYSEQWSFDQDVHWNACQCGTKGNTGFHADENQDGLCDTCQYQLRAAEPAAPPVDPTEPTATPTQPTKPATQPTTAPATEPAPIRQAEPPAPPAALWIGIGAAGVVLVIVLILLLKKKKR